MYGTKTEKSWLHGTLLKSEKSTLRRAN